MSQAVMEPPAAGGDMPGVRMSLERIEQLLHRGEALLHDESTIPEAVAEQLRKERKGDQSFFHDEGADGEPATGGTVTVTGANGPAGRTASLASRRTPPSGGDAVRRSSSAAVESLQRRKSIMDSNEASKTSNGESAHHINVPSSMIKGKSMGPNGSRTRGITNGDVNRLSEFRFGRSGSNGTHAAQKGRGGDGDLQRLSSMKKLRELKDGEEKENVTIDELKERIRKELEEYRRHGPINKASAFVQPLGNGVAPKAKSSLAPLFRASRASGTAVSWKKRSQSLHEPPQWKSAMRVQQRAKSGVVEMPRVAPSGVRKASEGRVPIWMRPLPRKTTEEPQPRRTSTVQRKPSVWLRGNTNKPAVKPSSVAAPRDPALNHLPVWQRLYALRKKPDEEVVAHTQQLRKSSAGIHASKRHAATMPAAPPARVPRKTAQPTLRHTTGAAAPRNSSVGKAAVRPWGARQSAAKPSGTKDASHTSSVVGGSRVSDAKKPRKAALPSPPARCPPTTVKAASTIPPHEEEDRASVSPVVEKCQEDVDVVASVPVEPTADVENAEQAVPEVESHEKADSSERRPAAADVEAGTTSTHITGRKSASTAFAGSAPDLLDLQEEDSDPIPPSAVPPFVSKLNFSGLHK